MFVGRLDIGKCAAENQGSNGIQEAAVGNAEDGIQAEEMEPTSKTSTIIHRAQTVRMQEQMPLMLTTGKPTGSLSLQSSPAHNADESTAREDDAFTILNVQPPGLKEL